MSQQTSSTNSETGAGALSGRAQLNNLRSDVTKPVARPSSATRGSSLTRQGSGGRPLGARSGQSSIGAANSYTAGSRGSLGHRSAAANGSTSVLTPPITASGHAAAGAAPPAARHTSSAATAAVVVPSRDSLTPAHQLATVRNNSLFNDDSAVMTPGVGTGAYASRLTPQLIAQEQQRHQHAEVSTPSADPATMAAGAAAENGAAGSVFRKNHYTTVKQPETKQPTHEKGLQTGDLFNPPDQDAQEPSVVVVGSTTQLVSPAWNQARPWLVGSWVMNRPPTFMQEAGGSPGSEQLPAQMNLQQESLWVAESALVDDLLSVMMGQAGQFIKMKLVEDFIYPRLGFWVQGAPTPGLQEQVERMLPLCEYAHVIKRFVETRSQIQYPMVVQALAAAMRRLQEEWWVLVVQLEHQLKTGKLNLSSLQYYCQTPAASLALLANIAGEASARSDLTSAGVLNLLVSRQRCLAGDRGGQALVGQLLEAAAEPYFGILRQWMCSGVLDDPYGEFMVKEDPTVKGDSLTPEDEAAYWSMHYTIRKGVTEAQECDVPVFLDSSMGAILVTGKSLNVIRACGQPVPPCPESTLAQLRYDAAAAERGSPPFLAGIQAALSAAAGALLAHMSGPQGRLLSWLHCLKHFFLLDQGDFLVHLMESGEGGEASSTPLSGLAPHQLQGLLDAALRSSSLAGSPHVDVVADGALAIKVDKRSILQLITAATVSRGGQDSSLRTAGGSAGVSCWEELMLSLNTSWPLNLVVGKRQLLHYQVLFKQLLSLKHAEKQLGYVWQALRATKRLGREDQLRFRPWHLLCSQLLHVVCEVLRYTSIDVLEPLWCDMHTRLMSAGNMDEVIQLHNAFLSAALERSLLLQAEVVRHTHAVLAAAKELSKVVESCDVQHSGTSGGGSSNARQRSASQHHLQVLSSFCRQATRQDQLGQLQRKVDSELDLLLKGLQDHYDQLSQAPLGPSPGRFKAGGAAGGLRGGGRAWGGVGVGDSSRELASLHNLIERLRMQEPSFELQLAAGL